MAGERDEDPLMSLGVSAHLARRYGEDQREFVEYLARILEGVMPDEAEVERRGGLFAEKRVRRLSLRLGGHRYTLDVPPKGPPAATRTRIVREVELKTDPMAFQDWLNEVGDALAEHARANERGSDALRKLLGG
jgi:hypothetical protein